MNDSSYQKIIIPKGSIGPDETVIIEIPTENGENRSFVATREPPRYVSSLPSRPTTIFSPTANSTQYETFPQRNYNVQSYSPRGRNPMYQTLLNPLGITNYVHPPLAQNIMADYTTLEKSNGYVNGTQNKTERNLSPTYYSSSANRSPLSSGYIGGSSKPYSTYGLQNQTERTFAPTYASTPIKFAVSSGYSGDSSNLRRADADRVSGRPTLPKNRLYTTFFNNGTSSKTSPLASNSNNYSTNRMEEILQTNAERKVHPVSNKVDLRNTNESSGNRGFVDYSRFAPPATSTPNKSTLGNYAYYSKNIPNQTRNIASESATSINSDRSYASDSNLNPNYLSSSQDSSMFYDLTDSPSGTSNNTLTSNVKNATSLTCTIPNAKRVLFEKSTTSVETRTEESDTLEDNQKKTNSVSVTTVTKETTSSDKPQSTPNIIAPQNQSVNTRINVGELDKIEAKERDQLSGDLRRWQEARRKLAMNTAKFATM